MRDVIGEAIKQDAKQLAWIMTGAFFVGWLAGAATTWVLVRYL